MRLVRDVLLLRILLNFMRSLKISVLAFSLLQISFYVWGILI